MPYVFSFSSEQALRLGGVFALFPSDSSRVVQRVCKLLHEISKHAETNQMTPKNLAIVMSPVLFHDEAESVVELAKNQGAKVKIFVWTFIFVLPWVKCFVVSQVAVLELLISQYSKVFPHPFEPVYKPAPRPGEVVRKEEIGFSFSSSQSLFSLPACLD